MNDQTITRAANELSQELGTRIATWGGPPLRGLVNPLTARKHTVTSRIGLTRVLNDIRRSMRTAQLQPLRTVYRNARFNVETFRTHVPPNYGPGQFNTFAKRNLAALARAQRLSGSSLIQVKVLTHPSNGSPGQWASNPPAKYSNLRRRRILFKSEGIEEESKPDLGNVQFLDFTVYGPAAPAGCVPDEIPAYITARGRSIVILRNRDETCGQRCLIWNMLDTGYKQRKFTNDEIFAAQMLDYYCVMFDMPRHARMTYDDFKRFSVDFHIGIIIFDKLDAVQFYNGQHFDKVFYILVDTDHYYPVRYPDKLVAKKKFCRTCLSFVDSRNFDHHRCSSELCNHCRTRFTTQEEKREHRQWIDDRDELICPKCNHVAYSQDCKELHEYNCDGKYRRCPDCKRNYNVSYPHDCSKYRCPYCNEQVPFGHRCYIQREASKDVDKIFVFDFESEISEVSDDGLIMGDVKHRPIAVAYRDISKEDTVYFSGYDCADRLAEVIIENPNSTWVALNGSGYDFPYVTSSIQKVTGSVRGLKITFNGTKMMTVSYKTIRFVDLLLHVKESLANLPKVFGLDENIVKKGFFPYAHPYSPGFVGEIPERYMFLTEYKSQKIQDEFEQWYTSRETLPYDYDKELEEYCVNDVNVLAAVVKAYVDLALQYSHGINPMQKATIAGFSRLVYSSQYMPENKMVILTSEEDQFVRRSLRGGCTGISNCYVKLTQEQLDLGYEIAYKDMNSMYPYIQWSCTLPVGIPAVYKNISNPHEFIQRHAVGFAHVSAITPKDILFPVLPTYYKGKLNFTCFDIDGRDNPKATFTLAELKVAIEKGYIITHIFEAHIYTPAKDLFSEYVTNYLRLKLVSASAPANVNEFCRECETRYGFQIEPHEFQKNPGRKRLAKLKLNSVWGKLAQRDLPELKSMTTPDAFEQLKILHNQGHVTIFDTWSGDSHNTLMVQFRDHRAKNTGLKSRSLPVASYITAWGRLMLRAQMEKCGSHLVGFDTDSCWYVSNPDTPVEFDEGPHLGQWESEVPAGKKIVAAAGAGAKTYALLYDDDSETVKAKGIIPTDRNMAALEFSHMAAVAQNKSHSIRGFHGPALKRRRDPDQKHHVAVHNIRDNEGDKCLQHTADKRLPVSPDFEDLYFPGFLLPYGHAHAIVYESDSDESD